MNFTKENQNQDDIFLVYSVAQEKQKDIWILDLGCNNHMTRNIEIFSNLDESVKSKVTFETINKMFVMGKGNFIFLTRSGQKCIFKTFVLFLG